MYTMCAYSSDTDCGSSNFTVTQFSFSTNKFNTKKGMLGTVFAVLETDITPDLCLLESQKPKKCFYKNICVCIQGVTPKAPRTIALLP